MKIVDKKRFERLIIWAMKPRRIVYWILAGLGLAIIIALISFKILERQVLWTVILGFWTAGWLGAAIWFDPKV